MVARSMPVGINPRPPKTDEDVERLKKLLDVIQRNMNGIINVVSEVKEITERLDRAA